MIEPGGKKLLLLSLSQTCSLGCFQRKFPFDAPVPVLGSATFFCILNGLLLSVTVATRENESMGA